MEFQLQDSRNVTKKSESEHRYSSWSTLFSVKNFFGAREAGPGGRGEKRRERGDKEIRRKRSKQQRKRDRKKTGKKKERARGRKKERGGRKRETEREQRERER